MLHLDARLPTFGGDLERSMLHVALDLGIVIFAADESFCVEDGAFMILLESIWD